MVSPLEIWLPISTCFKPTRPSIGAVMLGAGDGRFISFHRAGGFHHQRLLSVELLAGDEVGLHQLLVTSEIAAGVGKGGLIFRQLTLRLGESDFKLAGVDLRQQVAGFDLLTLLEVKAQQLAVGPVR